MNNYYTAKDIEELAASGTKQLVIGPGIFLTDYARVTAQQLGVALVKSANQVEVPADYPPRTSVVSNQYNKPSGCQHNSQNANAAAGFQAEVTSRHSNGTANSNAVNRLIDLMGKVIKRGS